MTTNTFTALTSVKVTKTAVKKALKAHGITTVNDQPLTKCDKDDLLLAIIDNNITLFTVPTLLDHLASTTRTRTIYNPATGDHVNTRNAPFALLQAYVIRTLLK